MEGNDHDRTATEQMLLTAETGWRGGPARVLAEPFLNAIHDHVHVAADSDLPGWGLKRHDLERSGMVLTQNIEESSRGSVLSSSAG